MQQVMWFRRDLRAGDHPALSRAVAEADGGAILPLFVIVPGPWERLGAPARSHVARSLTALREELDVTSPKDGCSPSGQCGCCVVLLDGKAQVSCQMPLEKAATYT